MVDSGHRCMEDLSLYRFIPRSKWLSFPFFGPRSFHGNPVFKWLPRCICQGNSNLLKQNGTSTQNSWPSSTARIVPWDTAGSHQKKLWQMKARRVLSPLLWKLLECGKMSNLACISKPSTHLIHFTWYMLSRSVMKERKRRKTQIEG